MRIIRPWEAYSSRPCSACDAAYAQVQLPCRTFILIIHTGTHICTYITYIHKVWSTCQKDIPRRSSGFRGSIFIQQRKQQSNCKDSINCRTKYTIQMLTAHFGLIKLSFDYAIVFCSIAIGIGDAIGSGLSWDCDLAMPCHAKCNWQSEGSCFAPASFRRNGTSGGSLMILCPQLELAWTQGTPFATLQSTRTTLSLKCRYMFVYLPVNGFYAAQIALWWKYLEYFIWNMYPNTH